MSADGRGPDEERSNQQLGDRTIHDAPLSKLQLLKGDELVSEVPVRPDREVLLGRSEHADLRVNHRSVSAAHARVYVSDGEVFVEDLQSESGTFVDQQPVNGSRRLYHRQRILLGQHAVVQPYQVRFDDPATQILVEMGLGRARTEADGRPADAADGAPAVGAAATADRPIEPLTQPVPRSSHLRSPSVLLGMIFGPLAVLIAIWGLLQILRPSAAVWRSVQISPSTLVEDGELVVQSPDIHPRDDLVVSLGGQVATQRSRRRGRVIVGVPDLGSRPGGIYDIPLIVRRGKFEVCRRMVQYVVQPEVGDVMPMKPEAGELLSIHGTGFADDPARMEIHFGDQIVAPVSSSPTKMAVRVPVLTRGEPVSVPLLVKLDDWVSSVEEPLEVRARVPRPLTFEFAAAWAGDRRAWLVRHLIGRAFYVRVDNGADTESAAEPAAARPEARQLPSAVEASLERWERVFALATDDPEIRIDVRTEGGKSWLVGVGGALKRPLRLSGWGGNQLAVLSAPTRPDLNSEMLCFWMAGTWNQFLDVFARGKPVQTGTPVPEYVGVLNQLVRWNLDGGGDGRPEAREIELLTSKQLEALDRAFMPIPAGVGSVSGRWRAQLDNVFAYPKGDYTVDVVFDLEQRRGRLSGTADLTLLSHEMEWKLAQTSVSGDLELGVPTELKLRARFTRPVRSIRLRGTFENGVLSGVFENDRGETGSWRAVRELEEAVESSAVVEIDA